MVHAGTGRPLAGASVAVRGADSALAGGGFTREDGTFRLDGLRPGRYTVRVRVLGYAPVVRPDVRVTDAAPAVDLGRLTLTPVPTELSSVQVTGQAVAIQTESSERSGLISARQMQELPFKGRDYLNSARLLPGVRIAGADAADALAVAICHAHHVASARARARILA